MNARWLCLAVVAGLICAVPVYAASWPQVTADENGHGTITSASGLSEVIPFRVVPDPTSSLQQVLIYDMGQWYGPNGLYGQSLNPGDLVAVEPQFPSEISDAIRWYNDALGAHFIFYSDVGDADFADSGFPTNLSVGTQVTEIGPEGFNWFDWDPGGPSYHFISDVPLPAAGWMGIALLGGLVALRRRAA